jgi:hypothetical protein
MLEQFIAKSATDAGNSLLVSALLNDIKENSMKYLMPESTPHSDYGSAYYNTTFASARDTGGAKKVFKWNNESLPTCTVLRSVQMVVMDKPDYLKNHQQ